MKFVAAYVAVLIALAAIGAPLGHDEAQYAIGGAALLGRDVSAYPLHRPVGMQVVAAPGVAVGGGDWAFRAIGIACTLAMLAAAYIYVRRAHPRVAGWAIAVFATSFAVVRRGAELMPDALASAIVLAFAAILVRGLAPRVADPGGHAVAAGPDAHAPRWRLAWLGPLAAAAFTVRYGSIGVLGAISLSAAIVWRRRLAANAGPLAVAALAAGALAIPHVLASVHATGSALGILRAASFAAGRGYTGDGLVFYASAWWLWLGPVAAVCVAAGVIAAIARRSQVAAFAGLASLMTLVVLGLDAHGEARFVLVPELLLIGSGVEAIVAWAFPRPRAAAAVVAIAFAGNAIAAGVAIVRAKRTFEVAVGAAGEVRRAAHGAPCAVVSGQWTQLEWYSGCWGVQMPAAITPDVLAGRAGFLVWYDEGRREPAPVLDDARAGRRGVIADELARVPSDGGLWGGATVFRLRIAP